MLSSLNVLQGKTRRFSNCQCKIPGCILLVQQDVIYIDAEKKWSHDGTLWYTAGDQRRCEYRWTNTNLLWPTRERASKLVNHFWEAPMWLGFCSKIDWLILSNAFDKSNRTSVGSLLLSIASNNKSLTKILRVSARMHMCLLLMLNLISLLSFQYMQLCFLHSQLYFWENCWTCYTNNKSCF